MLQQLFNSFRTVRDSASRMQRDPNLRIHPNDPNARHLEYSDPIRSIRIGMRGFTLIELLTVIAIIGILTTVVSVNVSSSRKQARDARRKSDIKAMQTALELYYNANGQFPPLAWGTNSNKSTWSGLQTALGSYLSTVPVDPVNNTLEPWAAGALAYGYASANFRGCTAGQWYVLVYGLENTKDTAIANSPGVRMCDGSVYNETSKGNIIVVGQGQ